MALPFLELTSAVKSAVPSTTGLGRLTLVLGPNGAGKTAIRQSLELALDGAVTGHLGRDTVKSPELLDDLFGAGSEDRIISAEFTDGRSARWTQARDESTSRYKRPSRDGVSARFPLREVEAALAGDLSKPDSSARRAFASWACAGMDEHAIDGMVDARLTSAERAKYADAHKAFAGRHRTAVDAFLAVLDYVRGREREVVAEARGARAAAEAARNEAAEAPAPAAPAPVLDYPYDLALRLLDVGLADEGDTFCPVCGADADKDVDARHLLSVVTWAENALRSVGIDPGTRGNRPVVSLAASSPVPTADRAAVLRATNDTVGALEQEAAVYGSMVDKLNGVLAALLGTRLPGFASRCTRYLPGGWKLDIDVRAGLRIGLERDGRVDTALSGIEWEVCKCAIAAAVTEGFNGLSILVPGDRAWDARTLRAFLEAIAASPHAGMVLVESTIEPEGGLPGGWDIVRVGPARRPPATTRPPAPGRGSDAPAPVASTPAAPAAPAVTVAPAPDPAVDSFSGEITADNLRAYAKLRGRRALKNLYRNLVGVPAVAAWNDEDTITALVGRLGAGARVEPVVTSVEPVVTSVEPVVTSVEPAAPVITPAATTEPVRPAKPAKPAKPPAAPAASIPPAYRRMILALGFTEEDIGRLLLPEAQRIVADGLTVDDGTIGADGRFVPTSTGAADAGGK